MNQTSLSLASQSPAKEAKPSGFYLQSWQKGGLLVLLLGILYLRIWVRKQAKAVYCSHCGKKNPPHQNTCQKCAAPLMRVD
ncbi:MAG TPA: zinc-ribbon domain-containing protein [Geothrix sp.]|nr:zinc-ribbon domain-containing protein [Geothrix sp.]